MKIPYDIKTVMEMLQINKLRNVQIKPMGSIQAGQDTFVLAPTSAGKSAMYQLPAIAHSQEATVVIEPTISLMHDQVQKLVSNGIAAEYLDSTMSPKEQRHTLKRFAEGETQILYLTPERLTSEAFLCAVKKIRLFMVVVDECHCVLEWGYGFRAAYLHIGEFVDSLHPRPVVAAFTATACPSDVDRICESLHMREQKVFLNDLYRKNLVFLKKHTASRQDKQQKLIRFIRKYHQRASVIYCNTKKGVEAVYELLQKKYPDQVVKCHSGMSAKERSGHELQFLSGERPIMVATTAFGMGVDLGTIDLIIHFNMPLSITDYLQQAGRAGRDGQKAHCVLLYGDDDYWVNRVILSDIKDTKALKRALAGLDAMKEYCCDRERCQAKLLLEAFAQHHSQNCNHCTTCQRKRREH